MRAHFLVCFVAYVLWKTLAQLCQRAGLGEEPRHVIAELAELRPVDVELPTAAGIEICTRCVMRPVGSILRRARLRTRIGCNEYGD